MQLRFLVMGLVLAALVIALWVWLRSQPAPVEAPPVVETVPEPAEVTPPAAVEPPPDPYPDPAAVAPEPALPTLDESDAEIRERVTAVSAELAPWLEREDLARRFSVVLENASRGDYPQRQLAFLAPASTFPVRTEGDRVWVDAKGYARYEPFIAVVTSIDPEQVAALWVRFSPLLVEALGELGMGDTSPESMLRDAIELTLATPVLTGEIELTQPSVLYEFADPELESLPPLQKQLLRMGPENLERLQAYLRELRTLREVGTAPE